jgi:lysyl-tRNA synthetase class 2
LHFWNWQLYCEKSKLLDEAFEQLKTSMDIGDFVGAKGTMKRTEKGQYPWLNLSE